MTSLTAIGITNNFSPGQSTICLGSPLHKPTGGIDVKLGFAIQHPCRNHLFNDLFDNTLL